MNSKPHPSSPSHAGNKLDSNTETQVAEQLAVARPTVRKYHGLVVLIELEESTLKTLKETLRDRGKVSQVRVTPFQLYASVMSY